MFTTFTNHMDGAVKNLQKTCADQTQKYQSHFKREYQTVGRAFVQLGAALQQDGIGSTVNLTNAVTTTGENYEEIGKMFDEQPKLDWEKLGDVMHDYRGMLGGWPGVLQIHAVSVPTNNDVAISDKASWCVFCTRLVVVFVVGGHCSGRG